MQTAQRQLVALSSLLVDTGLGKHKREAKQNYERYSFFNGEFLMQACLFQTMLNATDQKQL